MKARMKRLISIICVVSLLAGVILSTDFLSAKAETPSSPAGSLPTNMTEITFSDFGFEDGQHKYYPTKEYKGETMDKTLFAGKITFPKTAANGIQYGGKVTYGGFNILTEQNSDTGEWYLRVFDTNQDKSGMKFNYDLLPSVAGCELVGTEIELHIGMEFVNNDGGETKNDLKLGIWIGRKLYNNEYFYVNNYVDGGHSIGKIMTLYVGSKGMDIKSVYTEKMPTDMTEITFRDFGFDDKQYTYYPGKEYTGDTMDHTLFTGKVTFPEAADNGIQYGGKVKFGGINILTAKNSNGDWYLRVYDSNQDKSGMKFNYDIFPVVAGMELVGTEIELGISMEYVNNDGGTTEDDLKLGIWFGKRLYNNAYFYINNYVDTGHSIGKFMTLYVGKNPIDIKSVVNVKLPTNMKNISFRDFGVIDGKVNAGTTFGEYDGETLNGTVFSGKVTYSTVGETHFTYGGKGGLSGFDLVNVNDDGNGNSYLRLFDTNADKSGAKFSEKRFYSNVAGVPLIGKELDISFSMEFVNNDNGATENDLKLGVWFGGRLYDNQYIYINNYVDTGHSVGKMMAIWNRSGEFSVKSVGEINWKPLPTGMTEITFRDFGYVDGDVTGYPSGEYEAETMDNTLFSGKITFPETANVFLQYGGKMGGAGFNLGTAMDTATGKWFLRLFDTNADKSGAKFSEKKFYSDVALVELVGQELELNISMEYVDHDGGGTENDVKLGVWFGGKLYNNSWIYLDNFVDTGHSVGTWMSFYAPAKVKIESVGAINWKPMPTGMTEITFRDFGYINGKVTGYPTGQYEGETLDNTLFCGKITFPEIENVFMQYGGKMAGAGFNLGTAKDATTGEWFLRLFDTNADKSGAKFSEKKFYSDVALVELVGEELDLNISMEYVDHDDDGAKDDVKLGVWFDGKLYNNNYIYLDNFVNTGHSMGTHLSFYVTNPAKVMIESVGTIDWKPLPTGMTEITFRDFGFIDGDYTQYPSGEYEGTTLDNTMFIGKITFPEKTNAHLLYGGKVAGGGFDIVPAKNEETGTWFLRLFDSNKDKSGRKFEELKFYPEVAGMPLVGEEIALIITLEYIDNDGDGAKDDVKLGVWFGGKLYNNRYIYINDYVNTGHSMGTWMAFDISKPTIVNIKSVGEVNWKPLPTGFKELTFKDFGISAGVYEGGSKTGTCDIDSLDKTILSGTVIYSKEGETHLTYGGKTSLSGIDLVNVYDETTGEHSLRLFDTNASKEGKKFNDYRFYSRVAGVTLVGEELDLKISMEYVDNDADGAKDDVKLGIWFGGKLYNNRYILINDYVNTGHSIGNKMTIWSRNGSSFSVGRTSEWLNWSAFGLTSNWQKTLLDTDFNLTYALSGGNPYTGDSTTIPYLAMALSLAIIVVCGFQIVRRRQEEYGM